MGAGGRPAASAPRATWAQVLALRLARQHVAARTAPDRLLDVVADLVGVHAQVMSAAELQLAARIDGLRPDDVRDALWQHRRLVKVWAFRQTLHLLTGDDLALFVAAARSLERWHTPAWLRYFKLTESEVEALIEAVGAVLSDRPLTRANLVGAVTKRLARPELTPHLMTGWGTFFAPAAQRGHLVFGPSDGRNVAFVSPRAWLGRPVERRGDDADAADEALARLIVRYLAAFPGATKEMVGRWWGGGRMSAINRALSRLGSGVEVIDVEGARGLVLAGDVAVLGAVEPFGGVRLLPGFDPFTNELPRRVEAVLPKARHELVHRTAGWVTPIVVVDGRVAGTWEIGSGKRAAVEVAPFGRWRAGARDELAVEVDRLAAFLGRPLSVSVGRPVG